MSVAIRSATPSDAPEIARIYVESWAAGFGELMPPPVLDDRQIDRWAAELDGPAATRWWVAESDGRTAGFVGIGPSRDPIDERLGELDTIAVDPGCWRVGVGRALMAAAIEELSRAGYREAILWTVAGYDRGRRFYESQGWRPDRDRTRDGGRQIAFRRDVESSLTDPV